MPNYNHAHYLGAALQALLEQSFTPAEIIIVDDASTDNSMELLKAYAEREPRIRLVRNEQNRGVIYNLNRLLEWATSDYVIFVAADDLVLPELFAKTMAFLAQHPQAGLCSTRMWVVRGTDQERHLQRDDLPFSGPTFLSPDEVKVLLPSHGNWIHGNTCIYRRAPLVEAGGFLPELESLTDSFAAQILALRYGACFIPEPLAVWRYTEGSYSATTFSLENAPKIVALASELMRGQYKDAFPAGYDRIWERETFFTFARIGDRLIRAQQSRFFDEQRLRQGRTNLLNQICVGLLQATLKLYAFVTFCYLVTGYWPKQAARRRFNKTVLAIRSLFRFS